MRRCVDYSNSCVGALLGEGSGVAVSNGDVLPNVDTASAGASSRRGSTRAERWSVQTQRPICSNARLNSPPSVAEGRLPAVGQLGADRQLTAQSEPFCSEAGRLFAAPVA